MSELEPDDSRDVTLADNRAPGEPPRTGPREGQSRGEGPHRQGADGEEASDTGRNWRETEYAREKPNGDTAGGRGTEDDSLRAAR